MRSRAALTCAVYFALMAACWTKICPAAEPADRGAKSHLPLAYSRLAARGSANSTQGYRGTENFRITADRADVEKLARICEELRAEYQEKWLGTVSGSQWTPRCEVVLHSSVESYLAQVGRSGTNSSGCSTIRIDGGRIIHRRIDVRVDTHAGEADFMQSALPHELTHVVLADAFKDRSLPRWADEGIAVLVDPAEKREGRNWDLQHAISTRRAFRMAELLQLDEYPSEGRLGIFYGQSGSVVEYLVNQGTPDQFIRFVQSASDIGYDRALRNNYGLEGVTQLERQWLQSQSKGTMDSLSAPEGIAGSRTNRKRGPAITEVTGNP